MNKLCSIVLILFSANIYAQSPPFIYWQNTIGGNMDDEMTSIAQTADGGFICGGISESGISGDKASVNKGMEDYWIIKLDALGAIEWETDIGGSGTDNLRYVRPASDGGYICGGESNSGITGDKTEANLGDFDFWIVKLDSSGSIEWQNTIGGSGFDRLYAINPTSDGGYICGGSSNSNASPDKSESSYGLIDYWAVKLDSIGNIEWENTIGGNLTDGLFSIEQTSDGGYICGGFSWSDISGDKTEPHIGNGDYWIIKLDTAGSIVWQNTIGGAGNDVLYGVTELNNGGYICGGMSTSLISGDKTEHTQGANDYWIIMIDSIGNIIWQNDIGGFGIDWLYSIDIAQDGGFICGGYSESGISGDKTTSSFGGRDYWIVKLDSTGLIEWQESYGGTQDDTFSQLMTTTDGGYILGGGSFSPASGNKTENNVGGSDFWIIKLDSAVTSGLDENIIESFKIYPNPSTCQFRIQITYKTTSLPSNLMIYDAKGNILMNRKINSTSELFMDLCNYPDGIYSLILQDLNGQLFTGRFTLIR